MDPVVELKLQSQFIEQHFFLKTARKKYQEQKIEKKLFTYHVFSAVIHPVHVSVSSLPYPKLVGHRKIEMSVLPVNLVIVKTRCYCLQIANLLVIRKLRCLFSL